MLKLICFVGLHVAAIVAVLLLFTGSSFADAANDRVQLDRLLDQLQVAPDPATADGLVQQIWRIWMVPPDAELAGKMAAVLADETANDLDGALGVLTKMVVDYPAYAEGWNQRATIEYERQDFAASLADIDKVLALEPRHFGALSGKVLVYLAMGNRPQALKAMFAAMKVNPFLGEKQLFPELSQPQTQI
jgi:tetratricopeptide (TPR) repeat protein